MLSLGLIVPKVRASGHFTQWPCIWNVFGLAGENRNFSGSLWVQGTVTSNPFGWFFPWSWVVSSFYILSSVQLYTWGEPPVDLQASFSVQNFFLLHYSLWTQAALLPPDSQLREVCWPLLSFFLPVSRVTAWKLSQGCEQGQQEGWSLVVSIPQESLFFVAWYLVSWKPLFYTFCPFLLVLGKRVNLVPVNPFWLELEVTQFFLLSFFYWGEIHVM